MILIPGRLPCSGLTGGLDCRSNRSHSGNSPFRQPVKKPEVLRLHAEIVLYVQVEMW